MLPKVLPIFNPDFYIIVSGHLDIFIIRNNTRVKLNMLNPGDCLGRIHQVGDIRTACVSTGTAVDLIMINKSDFQKMLGVSNNKMGQIAMLAKFPFFQGMKGPGFLDACIDYFTFQTYDPKDIITSEFLQSDRIFWVISGRCKTSKVVKFIKRPDVPNYLPHQEGRPLHSRDEIVQEHLTIHELGTGHFFPPLPNYRDTQFDTEVSFDRDGYIEYLYTVHYHNDSRNDRYSLIADTECEIAYIGAQDLITHADNSILLPIIQGGIQLISLSDLQNMYIKNQKWNNYKRDVVDDILDSGHK